MKAIVIILCIFTGLYSLAFGLFPIPLAIALSMSHYDWTNLYLLFILFATIPCGMVGLGYTFLMLKCIPVMDE